MAHQISSQTQPQSGIESGIERSIPLPQTYRSIELIAPEDNWTGLSDPVRRRKIQNRLNQRAHRIRKKVLLPPQDRGCLQGPTGNDKSIEIWRTTNVSGNDVEYLVPETITTEGRKMEPIVRPTISSLQLVNHTPERRAAICEMNSLETRVVIAQFEQRAQRNYMLGSVTADSLLTLLQFNMHRALASNAQALGFGLEDIQDDDALSIFNTTNSELTWSLLPSSLRPTSYQRLVPHHPWLDLFPIPVMRENLIHAGDSWNEIQFCRDLVGFTDRPTGQTGIAIWGEAWDPANWEATEGFVKNWGWVLRGCYDLLKSTNRWRAQRGDTPLRFE
ncbi:MAG: hypothetical protein M1834_003657 [Cirrosporium novae-zelandiae]|nr:MAG: hypothetical protein M1834_003657 [Cirrosporium novae-zelandiae]